MGQFCREFNPLHESVIKIPKLDKILFKLNQKVPLGMFLGKL